MPEPDIRGIRGGSWSNNIMGRWDRPVDMHSPDQFSDLGFRVATLAGTSQPVPSLSAPALLALLLGIAFVGTIVPRARRRSSAG